MTTHKTISTLSIGAIAFLAAAAPSLAQVQSEQSSKDLQGSLVAPAVEQTLASNRELAGANASRVATTEVKRTSANNAAPTASPIKLSASAFKVTNHFTSAEGRRFVKQQGNFNDAGPKDPTAKKQFRAGDDESVSRTKGVNFVPSRGQKLPE